MLVCPKSQLQPNFPFFCHIFWVCSIGKTSIDKAADCFAIREPIRPNLAFGLSYLANVTFCRALSLIPAPLIFEQWKYALQIALNVLLTYLCTGTAAFYPYCHGKVGSYFEAFVANCHLSQKQFTFKLVRGASEVM